MKKLRLSQVIAVEKATKSEVQRKVTDAYHVLQKADLVSGLSRTYRPKDEENGDRLPPESKTVQHKAEAVLKDVSDQLARLFDLTLTKDEANRHAVADVVVDGKTLAEKVPVTWLLFLEKQLVDLATLVRKLPTLDPAERWAVDQAQDCWAAEPAETHRTKKVKRVVTLAQATKEHPAQVTTVDEDEVVGFWRLTKFSGAIPMTRQNQLLARIEALQKAVKMAREEANTIEAPERKAGREIFQWVLATA